MTTRRTRRVAAAATLVLLALGVAACSAGDSGSSDSGSSDSGGVDSGGSDAGGDDGGAGSSAAFDEDAVAAEAAPRAEAADSLTRRGGGARATPAAALEGDRSLIKTGSVALRSTDVGATVFAVRRAALAAGGEISEESTEADTDGEAERSLLTIRVPDDAFDRVVGGLKAIEGTSLIDASTTTEDVSTEVIDVDVRVELQRKSIERISLLLDRAGSVNAIVAIERELARREADLASLQQRQAFLADQTSMSTITVSVERPREKPKPAEKKQEKEDDDGFVAGLDDGWSAFTAVTTGLLTAAGAVLPFAVVLALLAVPLRIVLRRRRPAPIATAAAGPPAS